jgi:hypothetical protein
MAYAQCMLHTEGYKYTLRICNTHCFSTATLVARTRLNVTLYVHCLSCLFLCFRVSRGDFISSDQHSTYISDIYRAYCLLRSFNLPYLITVRRRDSAVDIGLSYGVHVREIVV